MIDTSKAVLWVEAVPTVQVVDGRTFLTVTSGGTAIRFAMPNRIAEKAGQGLSDALLAFYGHGAAVVPFPKQKRPRASKKKGGEA